MSGRSDSGDGKDTAVGHDGSWSEDIVDGMRFVRNCQTKVCSLIRIRESYWQAISVLVVVARGQRQ